MKKQESARGTSVLVVDDEAFARRYLTAFLEEEGYACDAVETAAECRRRLASEPPPDLLILDIRLPDGHGLELLEEIRAQDLSLPVIVITAYGSISEAVRAMKLGAFDFITKPFDDANRIRISIKNALEHRRLARENRLLRTRLQSQGVFQNIIGAGPGMERVFEIIRKAARVGSNILVEGESGTGKELAAEAIHNLSDRKDQAFVPINCAALPEALLESALFGYEKGAFTGAAKTTPGFFEEADGGTLFLDEIGDAPASVQAKILRAVEEGAVWRVGRTRPIPVDVRLVFATNKDLGREVAQGRFRRDLYFRINIIKITLPPLRERREDIPLLVNHFLERYCREAGIPKKIMGEGAIPALLDRHWPGNIRELKNMVERIVALHARDTVTAEDLALFGEDPVEAAEAPLFGVEFDQAKRNFEKLYFQRLLERHQDDLARAAEASGMHLATIYRKIKALGLKTG